jgi:hypothetical protein
MEINENFILHVGNLTWKHDGGMAVNVESKGETKKVWCAVYLAAFDETGKHVVSLFLNAPRIGSDNWTAYRIGYPVEAAKDPDIVTRAREAVFAFQASGFPIEPFELPLFDPDGKQIGVRAS